MLVEDEKKQLGFFFVALTKAREGPKALPDFGVAVVTDDPMSNATGVTSDVAGVDVLAD